MSTATLGEQVRPEELAAVVRPALEASNLPPVLYTSPEAYELELERVFRRTWVCVGRADELAEVGDALERPIGAQTIAIRRRGEGAGADAFEADRGYRVDAWQGFLFVNADPHAGPVADGLTEMSKWNVERYAFAEERSVHAFTWETQANWKLLVDNFVEEYHVAWIHAKSFHPTMPMKKWQSFPDMTDQPWTYMFGGFPGTSMSVEGPPLFPEIPTLGERELGGMAIATVYPNLMMIVAIDCLIYYFVLPTGPERSTVIAHLCLPAPVAERVRAGDPALQAGFREYVENTRLILDEDMEASDHQARGLRSRHARQGRLCKHELLLSTFHKWLVRTVYEPAATTGAPAA